jgi:hypothetical protein
MVNFTTITLLVIVFQKLHFSFDNDDQRLNSEVQLTQIDMAFINM